MTCITLCIRFCNIIFINSRTDFFLTARSRLITLSCPATSYRPYGNYSRALYQLHSLVCICFSFSTCGVLFCTPSSTFVCVSWTCGVLSCIPSSAFVSGPGRAEYCLAPLDCLCLYLLDVCSTMLHSRVGLRLYLLYRWSTMLHSRVGLRLYLLYRWSTMLHSVVCLCLSPGRLECYVALPKLPFSMSPGRD